MPDYFVQARLHTSTAIAEDYIVNTWSFSGPGSGVTEDDGIGLTSALVQFYQDLSLGTLLSEYFFGGIEFFVYEPVLSSPWTLGSPVYYFFETTLGGSGNGFPSEVAACLSWAAAPATGIPANRRRGRIYVGPLALTAGTGDPDVRLTSTAQDVLLDSFTTFTAAVGAADLPLCVWSRTEGAMYPVVRAWVDNAFDTVRARGLRATNREVRP